MIPLWQPPVCSLYESLSILVACSFFRLHVEVRSYHTCLFQHNALWTPSTLSPMPRCHPFLKHGFTYLGCAGWWLWCTGFLQLGKGGYSLRVGYGLWGTQAAGVVVQGPQSTGPVVVAHKPTCPAVCGIFPDQGSTLCAFAGEFFYPLNHQGSPILFFFWLSIIPPCVYTAVFIRQCTDLESNQRCVRFPFCPHPCQYLFVVF